MRREFKELPPGTVIDRYELIETIGKGGFGTVYKAKHVHVGHLVALKTLHRELVTSDELVKRFLREARAAASVGNNHIVSVFDSGLLPTGQPFLAMELLDGITLEDLLANGPLQPERFFHIAIQILEGLGAAHHAKIIHRDLKPGNIFLTRDQGQEFVKILDFGVSKMKQGVMQTSITEAGEWLGTPLYMSPEQFVSSGRIDHRSDLYSASVVFYEMLSGTIPIKGGTPSELAHKIPFEPHPPLDSFVPHLPSFLYQVIDRGLAKDPDARWPHAQAYVTALRASQDPHSDEHYVQDSWANQHTDAAVPDDRAAHPNDSGTHPDDRETQPDDMGMRISGLEETLCAESVSVQDLQVIEQLAQHRQTLESLPTMPIDTGLQPNPEAPPIVRSKTPSAWPIDTPSSKRKSLVLGSSKKFFIALFILAIVVGGGISVLGWTLMTNRRPESGPSVPPPPPPPVGPTITSPTIVLPPSDQTPIKTITPVLPNPPVDAGAGTAPIPQPTPPEPVVVETPTIVGNIDRNAVYDLLERSKPSMDRCRQQGRRVRVQSQIMVSEPGESGSRIDLAGPGPFVFVDRDIALCVAQAVEGTAGQTWQPSGDGIIQFYSVLQER